MHEDIIQVGMLGLLGAIRRYDYSIGNAFEPFAIPTIVGEIKSIYVIKLGAFTFQGGLKI